MVNPVEQQVQGVKMAFGILGDQIRKAQAFADQNEAKLDELKMLVEEQQEIISQENPTKTALMLIKDDLLETLYHLGFEQVEPNVFLRSEEVYGSIKFSVSDDGNSIVATMYWSDSHSQHIKTYPFYTNNNLFRRG